MTDEPDGRTRLEGWLRWCAPLAIALCAILAWDLVVRLNGIPPYILPGPGLVAQSLVKDFPILWPSLLVTLRITAMALAAAIVGGAGLAILFSLSRWVELSLFPFAVILQVTPIVAIAPLILIYVDNTYLALLTCAWIVAFFPILANTTLGLNSVDHNLRDPKCCHVSAERAAQIVKGVGLYANKLLVEILLSLSPTVEDRGRFAAYMAPRRRKQVLSVVNHYERVEKFRNKTTIRQRMLSLVLCDRGRKADRRVDATDPLPF